MIPLKDNIPSRRLPVMNVTLIVVNIIVFFYEISLGKEIEYLFYHFGIIPKVFLENILDANISEAIIPVFTSMFLHGGILHLIGNMLFLWIFGDNVEDRLGHVNFLFFYIFCGIFAAIIHIITNPASSIPTIGASGAVAGVLGAYFILYPLARVSTLVFIGFFLTVVHIPAIIFLGVWFLVQFFQGTLQFALLEKDIAGIAWWAHVGGFVCGMFLVTFFGKRKY